MILLMRVNNVLLMRYYFGLLMRYDNGLSWCCKSSDFCAIHQQKRLFFMVNAAIFHSTFLCYIQEQAVYLPFNPV